MNQKGKGQRAKGKGKGVGRGEGRGRGGSRINFTRPLLGKCFTPN